MGCYAACMQCSRVSRLLSMFKGTEDPTKEAEKAVVTWKANEAGSLPSRLRAWMGGGGAGPPEFQQVCCHIMISFRECG